MRAVAVAVLLVAAVLLVTAVLVTAAAFQAVVCQCLAKGVAWAVAEAIERELLLRKWVVAVALVAVVVVAVVIEGDQQWAMPAAVKTAVAAPVAPAHFAVAAVAALAGWE